MGNGVKVNFLRVLGKESARQPGKGVIMKWIGVSEEYAERERHIRLASCEQLPISI